MILSLQPWGYSPLGRSKQTKTPGTLPSLTAAATGTSEIPERGLVYGYGWLGRSPFGQVEWIANAGYQGTAAATAPAITITASGWAAVTGSAAATIQALTASATGSVTQGSTGIGAAILPAATASVTGYSIVDNTGTVAATLGAITASATGRVPVTGTAAAELLGISGSAAGLIRFTGTGSASLGTLAGSAAGLFRWSGTGAAMLPAPSASASGYLVPSGTAAATLLQLAGAGIGTSYNTAPRAEPQAVVTYSCVLTGAADGLADLTLQLATLQIRHREGGSSRGQISVPNGAALASGISARPNGEVVVTWHQGSLSEEAVRFAPSSVRLDRGAKSSGLTIAGEYTASARQSKLFDLSGVSYIATDGNGNKRYRAQGRGDIRPADQVRYEGTVDTVGEVVWSVSVGGSTMELALEAAA